MTKEKGHWNDGEEWQQLFWKLEESIWAPEDVLIHYKTRIIIRVFCPRASPSLQAQEPRPQFCRRQVFHRKLRNQGCSFTRDWTGVVASHCFLYLSLSLSLSLFSIWKDPRALAGRWGEWIWLTGPSRLYQNSPQGLNISSIRIFDQIRDPEIPVTLHPQNQDK